MLVFLLVTLIVLAGSGLLVRSVVSKYLTSRFEENSQITWKFLAGATLEPLLSRDLPLLDSIFQQSFANDDQILFMEIDDREGKSLIRQTNQRLNSQLPPFIVSQPIEYDQRPVGRLTIHWATDRALAQIEREGLIVLSVLAMIVGVFACVMVFLVSRLVVKPIRRIHAYLLGVVAGKADRKLSLVSSRELNYLVQSANSLQEHVEADRIRHQELQSAVKALTNRVARLGQYTLLDKIGEGGMGSVYLAQHALLRRPTAIKLLRSQLGGPDALIRFEREVQLTSGLTHPNTIAIYDYGRTDQSVFYYAMEFLEGVNLEQLVQDFGPQPAARVVFCLRQIAGSLKEAHAAGLIHRDVKPANVFLCQRGGLHDFVKVLDFGLVAEVASQASPQAAAIGMCGTPHYMAPEAIENPASVDARSDLYALAAVGFFLLTGRPLFPQSNIEDILRAQVSKPAPSLNQSNNILASPILEQLIQDCLRKNPKQRPPNAEAFLLRLQTCPEASAWTEIEAASWWQSHPQALLKPKTPGQGIRSTMSLSRIIETPNATMTVDFHRRPEPVSDN